MLSGLFLRFGTIFGPILANFWVEIKACGASRAMPCDQGYPVLKNIHSYKKKPQFFTKTTTHPVARASPMLGEDHFAMSWV